MSYTVTIKTGLADIALPGGTIGQGGQTYTLTDDQFLMLSPTAAAALFSSWSHVGGAAPGVFDPTTYGAKGDGQIVTDGAMTSGSPILACTTSLKFLPEDVGKLVMVKGAGSAAATCHIALIQSVTNSGHVVLSANASTSISGAMVLWATDDTVAFQAAIDAAVAYGLAHSYNAVVQIPAASGRFYGIGGALRTGGTSKGNSQLTLPVLPVAGNKLTLTFEGLVDGSSVQHWLQLVPQTGGSTLVSFLVHASPAAQITSINDNGNSAVIGGPSQPSGYGTSALLYTNLAVNFRNMSILTTHSASGLTMSALDLSGVANATLSDFAYGTAGSVTGGDYVAFSSFASGLSIGVLFPASGNNDSCLIRNVTCHGGYTYGFFATEHSDIYAMRILYCWAAFCPVGYYYGSAGSSHAIVATMLSIESCSYLVYILGQGAGGIGPFIYLKIDTEGTPKFGDNTSGQGLAATRGEVAIMGLYTPANLALDNPVGFDIIDGQRSYPAISVAADYAVSSFDEMVLVNCTAAAHTVTLPTAVGRNRNIVVVKTDASVNAVNIATTSSQTVNGTTPVAILTQWSAKEYLPTPTGNWVAR